MIKGELKEAIRSAKVDEMLESLPENGDFSCVVHIHGYTGILREDAPRGELQISYFPETVVVKGRE